MQDNLQTTISQLINRLARLRMAMSNVKERQNEHECQIDTLAFEVHRLDQDVKRLEEKMEYRFNLVDARFEKLEIEMENRFDAVDQRFNNLESDIKEIKHALGI